MINLFLKTEHTFMHCLGFVKHIIDPENVPKAIGIADQNNTFGHYGLVKSCGKMTKPILGVRLMVIEKKIEKKKQFGPWYVFIAKNDEGLQELNQLVCDAYDQFHYHPLLTKMDLRDVSENIFVMAEYVEFFDRLDFAILSQRTPRAFVKRAKEVGCDFIAGNNNSYTEVEDKSVYQLLAGHRSDRRTIPQHVMNDDEWMVMWGKEFGDGPVKRTYEIARQCNAKMQKAERLKYHGAWKIDKLCEIGARSRGIDLSDPEYKARYEYELELIERKEYTDYFLVVAELVRNAKLKMLVGPGRGSSGGSLICYLLKITELDPIRWGLLFERFIDINRNDLPDIDIDFPDDKRKKVIAQMKDQYGEEHVRHIATISKLKPKSALAEFAKSLEIHMYELDEVKTAMIERSGGDARASMCIMDTFETTEAGQKFIEEHPSMKLVSQVEGHARHAGVHAAGIIVCNEVLTKYAGVNSRDDVIMLDGKEAEAMNLLKIDCLGLRTLAVLEECAKLAGFDPKDYYKLPFDDAKTYKLMNDMRLSGIFQFEGFAMRSITRQMGVEHFEDIVAIGALGRPGPIHSGGAYLFVDRRTGKSPVEYLADDPIVIKHTESTYGVIIYQEQVMSIGREYGGLEWSDVQQLRKAMGKSLGKEFFGQYMEKFVAGAVARGRSQSEAENVWKNMVSFGSWGFNRSHAVAYGMISYWTAWAKANYPLEFATAVLNNARSSNSALKLLRDMNENEGIEYEAFDIDESGEKWTVHEGKLLGGITNIDGFGPKKAKDVIARRITGKFTPALIRKLMNPVTPFDILWPTRHFWGHFFTDPTSYDLDKAPHLIRDVQEDGEYYIIGRIVTMNLRDLNEYRNVVMRGGTLLESNSQSLNFTLEDDTDALICTINRFAFDEIGAPIVENAKMGEDWYLAKL